MSVLPASKATVERVKALLRRDLKLGPDANIPDDMPLMGGRLDLDSLDVLMVITTIEKDFGIKAPADGSAKAIFQSVATLSDYLQTHAAQPAAATRVAPKISGKEEALARLPHRAPFRFVSRLDELHPGESGRAAWIISGEEAFFAGHFPGRPIVPGVLLGEALAQLSGIVAGAASPQTLGEGRLAQVNLRFHQAVSPPGEITLVSSVTKMLGTLAEFQVRATHGGQTLADGGLTISLVPSAAHAEAGR